MGVNLAHCTDINYNGTRGRGMSVHLRNVKTGEKMKLEEKNTTGGGGGGDSNRRVKAQVTRFYFKQKKITKIAG